MSEKTILRKLDSLDRELKTLASAALKNSISLQKLSDAVANKISVQVLKMEDLAIRWNCSEIHAREMVSHYRIPLVRSKNNRPRRPHCVLLSEIVKFESVQDEDKRAVVLRPPEGKTARGFLPYVKSSQKPQRLGDLRKGENV